VNFCLLPAALAHVANISVMGLHYVLIYVSYNEMLFLIYLFHFVETTYLPHLWKTSHGRARWLQHLIARTLSQKYTGRDAWPDQHSKPQISGFACMSSQAMSCVTKEDLAWHDLRETQVSRGTLYPYNSGRSISSNVWSSEPRFNATWPWH
jgi:hypothetical protein